MDGGLTAATGVLASVFRGEMRNSKGWDDRHVWKKRGSDLTHQSLPSANRQPAAHVELVLCWTHVTHQHTRTYMCGCVRSGFKLTYKYVQPAVECWGLCGFPLHKVFMSDHMVKQASSPCITIPILIFSICSPFPPSATALPLCFPWWTLSLCFLHLSPSLKSTFSPSISPPSPVSVSGLRFC